MWGHETTSKNQETKEMNHGGDNEASLVWNASAMSQHPVPVAEKRRRFHFCAPGESVGAPVPWFCGSVVLYGFGKTLRFECHHNATLWRVYKIKTKF